MEQKMIKRSIFKQPIHRRIYEFLPVCPPWNAPGYLKSFQKEECVDIKEIFTCELELPLLNKGDFFYIEELDKKVCVQSVMRTSKDSVCYTVDPLIIDDEVTQKTFERAINVQNIQDLEKENSRLREIVKKVKQSFWSNFIDID